MLRNPRVQMAAVLAAGALLGYLAASGSLRSLSPARAAAAALAGAQADAEEAIVFEVIVPAKADLEMKRQALAKASSQSPAVQVPSWQHNATLMEWLRSL